MRKYPTNLTDSQYDTIIAIIYNNRKRKRSLKPVLDAILYLLKTGCQWRMLPSDFPCWRSVYYYFTKWSRDNGAGTHLYSWMALYVYKDQICPDGWRVPVADDFLALNLALGGTGEPENQRVVALRDSYLNDWGAEYNGSANGAALRGAGTQGNYWTLTQHNDWLNSCITFITTSPEVHPRGAMGKNNGVAVRCVKDL